MTSLTQVLASLYQLALLIGAWVVRGVQYLACLLEPVQPPTELPLATLTPFPFRVASEGVPGTGTQSEVPQNARPLLSPPRKSATYSRCNLEPTGAGYNMIHVEKRKLHNVSDLLEGRELSSGLGDERGGRCANPTPSFFMEDAKLSPSTSPTQSVFYTPSLFGSLTSTPLTSPCPSLEEPPSSSEPDSELHKDERLLKARKFEAEIGELGRRRGFKGAPLFTQGIRKHSPFLSLQNLSSRSPTSSTSISPRPPSPRTPLSAVTNMIRSVSSSKPANPGKEIPERLQELIDQEDPFATSAGTFFTSSVSFGDISTTDLDNFGSYHQYDGFWSRTPSLKRKSNFEDLRAAASPKRAGVRSTFYDMSTSSLYAKEKLSSRLPSQVVCASPKIVLTVPSAPSSPTKMNNCIAGGTPDPGTSSNVALDMSHPDTGTYEASPPGLLPISNLSDFHADDRFWGRASLVLEKEKGGAFPDHENLTIETDDSEFVTCALGARKSSTTTVDIIIYDPTSRQRIYQDDSVDDGFSVTSPYKSITGDKFDYMPESPKFMASKNMYDFDIYKGAKYSSPEKIHGSYCLTSAMLPTFNLELANMETNIYDLSVYSEEIQPPYGMTVECTWERETTASPTRRVQIDQKRSPRSDQTLVDEPDTSLLAHVTKTPSLRSAILATRPANCSVKFGNHKEPLLPQDVRILSSEKKGSSGTKNASHVMEPRRVHRSQGLDDIIALLDACGSESSQDVVPARRSMALREELWDEGSLFELYAI